MEDKDQTVREIESIISQIQGVASGRLVCRDGDIAEIHVLADKTCSPKQIVRDIESAVLIKMGLELNHKQISVAQLETDMLAPANDGIRFQLKGINYSAENGTTTIMVTIKTGDNLYTAKITGPNSRQNRLKLTASATLSAIEQYLNVDGKLVIGDVQRINLCGQEIIISAFFLHSKYQEELLLGTAVNRGDDLESTVRASLDAINRRLSLWKNN